MTRPAVEPLTVEQVAEMHPAFTVKAVRAAIHNGRLRATKIGRRFFTTPEDVERWIRCPAKGSRRGSPGEKTDSSGSSGTVKSTSGQVKAEMAIAKLYASLRSTSKGSDRPVQHNRAK